MRTTTVITPENRKHPKQRTVPKRYPVGSSGSQEKVTKVGKPVNGFLTSVFKPIYETDVNPLFRPENYCYLYNSAKNCAGLLGENFVLEHDPRNFEAICDKLDSLLPKDMEVRLFEKNNKIHLKIIDNLADNLLYYIPCKIIDETEGEFRDILIEFFRLLQDKQRMTPLLESQHFEMWKEEVENYYDNMGEEPDDEWMELVKRYVDGDISKTLKLVDEKTAFDVFSLQVLIDHYKPDCEREQKILCSMKKGLNFLKAEKVLLHYTNAPRLRSEEYPVDADETFMIIYDDDMILENLIEYMNNYACESGYEFFSSVNRTVTPRTRGLFKPDKFVIEFLEWINDFCYVLYNG